MTTQGGVTVEIGVAFDKSGLVATVDADYTNIASYNETATIDRGGDAYALQDKVTEFRSQLVNTDNRFNPDNTTGPYYGKLGPDHPIRVRANANGVWRHRFQGLTGEFRAEEFTPAEGKPYSVAYLTAYGTLWIPGRTALDGSGYREMILAWSPAPKGYYRMGERDTPTFAYDETGNRRHGTYTTGARAPGSGLLTADNNGASDFGDRNVVFYTATKAGFAFGSGEGVAFLYSPAQIGPTYNLVYCGGLFLVNVTATGQLTLDPPGAGSATTTMTMQVNKRHVVVLRREAAGVNWHLELIDEDGNNESETLAGTASYSFALGTPVVVQGLGVVDEVATWIDDPGSNLAPSMANMAFGPGASDGGFERFADFMARAGVPAAFYDNQVGEYPYAAATSWRKYAGLPGSTPLAALQALAVSETSQIYEANNGVITRKPYAYPETTPTPAVTIDDVPASANPRSHSRAPVRSQQDRRTRSVASDGAQTAVVENAAALTGAPSDDPVSLFPGVWSDQPFDVALRRSRQRFEPGSRVDPVRVRLSSMTAAQRDAVLLLNRTSQIATVRNGVTIQGEVVRMLDTITGDEYSMDISTEPNPPRYIASFRATAPDDQTASSTVASVGMHGETWDYDGQHPSVQHDAPTVPPTSSYLHDDERHLLLGSLAWLHNATAGYQQVEIADHPGSVIMVRTTEPSVGPTDGNLGPCQVLATLFEAAVSSTVAVALRAKTTSGSVDVIATERLGVPELKFAPSLTGVKIASATPAAKARRSTSQSVTTSSTPSPVSYDTQDFDVGAMFAPTSPSLITPEPGVWFLGHQGLYQSNATGQRGGTINVGGTQVIGQNSAQAISGAQTGYEVTTLWKGAAGTDFRSGTYQDSGSTLTLDVVGKASPVFWAVKLAAPSCRVTLSAGLSSLGPSGFWTNPSWNVDRWDDVDEHGGQLLTAKSTRLRLIWSAGQWAASATGERGVRLTLQHAVTNDTQIIAQVVAKAPATGKGYSQVWAIWPVELGDSVYTEFVQTHGSTLALEKAADYSPEFGWACVSDIDWDPTLPNEIAGLEAWYKADSLGLADGTALTSWGDSSSHARHALQTTAGNRPTLQTNELNGLPVVRFDGTNDYLTAAFGLTIAQPTTIFCVASTPSTTGAWRVVDGIAGGGQQAFFGVPSGAWDIYAGTVLTGPARDTSPHVFVAAFNGASSKIRVDGGAGTTGAAGSQSINGLTIGAVQDLSVFHPGDIAEVIVYSGSLSLANINAIGAYLAVKYGLGWAQAT